MPVKPEKKRRILIPVDTANPDIKVIHFQHNGKDKYVPLGKVTVVPDWLFENNPDYAQYEVF